ncbi:MAG: hypothetical protein IT559_01025 [Alphaproteobacteria bacterium]|nr:hypothetical protein [Alphaproteobacteria bacterium]
MPTETVREPSILKYDRDRPQPTLTKRTREIDNKPSPEDARAARSWGFKRTLGALGYGVGSLLSVSAAVFFFNQAANDTPSSISGSKPTISDRVISESEAAGLLGSLFFVSSMGLGGMAIRRGLSAHDHFTGKNYGQYTREP